MGGEGGRGRRGTYVLVDTGELAGRAGGREGPCVSVFGFVVVVVVAEDSARAPQGWFLAVGSRFVADC